MYDIITTACGTVGTACTFSFDAARSGSPLQTMLEIACFTAVMMATGWLGRIAYGKAKEVEACDAWARAQEKRLARMKRLASGYQPMPCKKPTTPPRHP